MEQPSRNIEALHSLFSLSEPKQDNALKNVLVALEQLEQAVEHMAISYEEINNVVEETNSGIITKWNPQSQEIKSSDTMVQDHQSKEERSSVQDPQMQEGNSSVQDPQPQEGNSSVQDPQTPEENSLQRIGLDPNARRSTVNNDIQNPAETFDDDEYDEVFSPEYYKDKKAIESIKKELEIKFKKNKQFLPSFESFQRSMKHQKHLPQIKIQDKIPRYVAPKIHVPSPSAPAALQMTQKIFCCTSKMETQHNLKPDASRQLNWSTGPTQQQNPMMYCGSITSETGDNYSSQNNPLRFEANTSSSLFNTFQPCSSGKTLAKKSLPNRCSAESPLRDALQAKTTLYDANIKKRQSRKRKLATQNVDHGTHHQNTVTPLNVQHTSKRFGGEINYVKAMNLRTNFRSISTNVMNVNNSKGLDTTPSRNASNSNNRVSFELRRRLAEPNIYGQGPTQYDKSLGRGVVSFTEREVQIKAEYPTPVNPAHQSTQEHGATYQLFSGGNYHNSTNAGYLIHKITKKEDQSGVHVNRDSKWNYEKMRPSPLNNESYKNVCNVGQSNQDRYSSRFVAGSYNYSNRLEYGADQRIHSDLGRDQQLMSEAGSVQQLNSEVGQQNSQVFKSEFGTCQQTNSEYDSNNGSGYDFGNYGIYQKPVGNFACGQTNNLITGVGQKTHSTYGTGVETAWNAQDDGYAGSTGQKCYYPAHNVKTEEVDLSDWDKERSLVSGETDRNDSIGSSVEIDSATFQQNNPMYVKKEFSSSDENIQSSISYTVTGAQHQGSTSKLDSRSTTNTTLFGINNPTYTDNNFYNNSANQGNMQPPYPNTISQTIEKASNWTPKQPQLHNPWFYQ